MHTQKQIPCANAQSESINQPPFTYIAAKLPTELTSKATGLAGLLANVNLLALATIPTNPAQCIDSQKVSVMQSHIQSSMQTLCDTLAAITLDVASDPNADNKHVTPYLLAEFSALVAELIPILNELYNGLTYSQIK